QLGDGTSLCDPSPYFEAFRVLSDSLYLGAARNAINVGAGSPYYDLVVGEQFISVWNSFSNCSGRLSGCGGWRVHK
ncbi:MAG: hypothetical protein LC790_02530, partial [Actinobacteria bacterium]|nr:hypothetical protein [Actinomycetota bacterium]